MSVLKIQSVIDNRYRQLRLKVIRGEMSVEECKTRLQARFTACVSLQRQRGDLYLSSAAKRSFAYSAKVEAAADREWLGKKEDNE
jgi:hypothetical protein